jgi:hypothetical protein
MAIFVRPATWSYDIDLFRAAAADEDELEAMLAAIATADQALWVVESDERPVAFAWTATEPGRVRLLRLHVKEGEDALPLLEPLLERIREEAEQDVRLEAPAIALGGIDNAVLTALGLR